MGERTFFVSMVARADQEQAGDGRPRDLDAGPRAARAAHAGDDVSAKRPFTEPPPPIAVWTLDDVRRCWKWIVGPQIAAVTTLGAFDRRAGVLEVRVSTYAWLEALRVRIPTLFARMPETIDGAPVRRIDFTMPSLRAPDPAAVGEVR